MLLSQDQTVAQPNEVAPPDAQPVRLTQLPEELITAIAKHVLALELPACLHLRQSSKELREVIDMVPAAGERSVRAQVEARRLHWEEAVHCTISSGGMLVVRSCETDGGNHLSTAHGPLLPVAGTSSWAIKVESSYRRAGDMRFGVCDRAGLNAWGLGLNSGMLCRFQLDANGAEVYPRGLSSPEYWPDGHCTQIVKDDVEAPLILCRKVVGAVMEVHIDHDHGVLSYRVNGGVLLEALKGFPKGTAGQLRPFAQLCNAYDGVRFLRPYMLRSEDC